MGKQAGFRYLVLSMMSDSPGQILQRARQDRDLTLDAVSKATHIRLRYLQALEADDLPGLPSLVQGKGFLRLYAGYLGLDEAPLLEKFGGQAAPSPEPLSVPYPAAIGVDSPQMEQEASSSAPTKDGISSHAIIEQAIDLPFADRVAQTYTSGKKFQQIFDEIGQDLRSQREQLSLSLAEVEKHTHVRTHYLQALEEGRMQDIPSFVQARGLLANYTHFLNLDSDRFLLRFADALQTRRAELIALQEPARKSGTVKREISNPVLRRFLSLDLLVTGGVIVILISFITWGASRVLTLKAEQKGTATSPAAVDILIPSATPALSQTIQTTQILETAASGQPVDNIIPTFAVSMPAPGSGAIQLSVVARQRAWLMITVDGKVKFNGRTTPGNVYAFDGNKQVDLLTGSGSALQVYFNGNDMGVLGSVGQVVNLVFTPQGMVNPTPSTPPAITTSPRITATLTPTAKPGVKPTPKP
jgi:cytoskeletal protein RodZ